MIDLRSDTVTRPSAGMWEAMRAAPLDDDVLSGDPSVRELERFAAELFGLEAAIFASSGTQTNLLALLSHCDRGDEYIVGQMAHCYRWEAGGAAVHGSIQPQPLANNPDGTIDPDLIESAIKPDDPHYAITKLIALENTWNGQPISLDYQNQVAEIANSHGLSMHLDGARVFNAIAELGCSPVEIAAPFDSVSVCLSKGLGSPVGSVLLGSQELINRAKRHRKRLGGSMRQAGMLAAAGKYGIEHNAPNLKNDHANARRLAEGLAALDTFSVDLSTVKSNMVFADVTSGTAASLAAFAASHDILLLGGDAPNLRFVTHLDVSAHDIETVIDVLSSWTPS